MERELMEAIGERMGEASDPWDLLVTGLRAFLDACTDDALRQIALIDAPAVLGWEEWREIDARYGLGLVSFGLRNGMDAGVFREREVTPLAHLVIGAMTEAALMIANAADPDAARRTVEPALLALLEGLRSD
jgi:hypothetical protein